MTWLGTLNFLVLQWFGVRLARVYFKRRTLPVGAGMDKGWKILRWVWPLTGWWSDYRWITRHR